MKIVKNKKLMIGLVIALLLATGAATLLAMSQKTKTSNLSDQEIRTKFACDRITQEVRETDVFCNPELYRNPELSEERYSKYMNCDERLKNPPTPEIRTHDMAYTDAYDICADKTKFNQDRIDFNNRLKELKAKN
jgi:Tfp pilus assembly protein PilW